MYIEENGKSFSKGIKLNCVLKILGIFINFYIADVLIYAHKILVGKKKKKKKICSSHRSSTKDCLVKLQQNVFIHVALNRQYNGDNL